MLALRLVIITAVFATLVACGDRPEPRGIAITDVTVIDAAQGLREQQTVIFDGDEIIAVGGRDDELPPAVETIDGSGKFLIPGLWDMHVHLTYDDDFVASMPAMFLYYGVTSVRDTGGLLDKLDPVIAKMRADDAHAPRVRWSGPLLDGGLVVYDGKSRPHIGTRNASVEEARANVAMLADRGADFIKIYELVSPDVFEALASAAAEHELPIAAHVPLSMTAIMAGPEVNSMEHLRNVELACARNAGALHEARRSLLADMGGTSGYELRSSLHSLQRLPAIANYDAARCAQVLDALSGTIQVPTLRLNAFSVSPVFARDDWDDALALLPAAARKKWQEDTIEQRNDPSRDDTTFGDWSLKLTGDMNTAGVPVGAGTDTPIAWAIPGYSLHSELEMLERAGLTPLEVIESATVRPAQFFGLDDEMGMIEVGKRADLLLLNANPLDSISNTRNIATVVSRGRVMSRQYLQDKLREAVTEPQ